MDEIICIRLRCFRNNQIEHQEFYNKIATLFVILILCILQYIICLIDIIKLI